jgi:glutamate carboxypeptidase
VPTPPASLILDYLERQESAFVGFLESLVRIESPSESARAQEPVFDLLEGALAEVDFGVRRIAGSKTGGMLLARPIERQRRRPIQVMVGHCDTVWPLGTLETMPIRADNGRLSGPGVYDMKCGLAMMVFALRALAAAGVEPTVTPVILINSDEEVGSEESRVAVARLSRCADRVLVLEPAMGPEGRIKTARKGVGHFSISVEGKAAHAGLEPDKGVSAILELSYLVQELFALNRPEAGLTVNVGTIDGGLRPNVIAPTSRADVDVRVVSMEQAREVERAIRALKPRTPGCGLSVEGVFSAPPLERTPRNRALWQLARVQGDRIGLELEECLAGGGSDGNTASLYAPTLDGLGAVGDGAHAAHEFVEIEPTLRRIALLALLLAEPPLNWTEGSRATLVEEQRKSTRPAAPAT